MMIDPARTRGRPRRNAGGLSPSAAIQPAAVSIFAQKGFDATSMREIAAAANVDAALIAYQFGSKLGLWKAIVSELGARLFAELASSARCSAGTSPAESLRNAMLVFIDFALRNPEFPNFLLRDAKRAEGHARYLEGTLARPLFDHYRRLIETAHAAGQLCVAWPAMVILHFSYGVSVMISRRELLVSHAPELADDEAFRAALCDTLIEPLFRHG